MSTATGYLTTVRSSGTATSFTTEAMSGSGVGPYEIDDTTKEIWDRDTTLTFYEDGSPISASDVLSIDYLFGKVTFVTNKLLAITVSGKYMPMTNIAGANSYNLNLIDGVLDDTEFGITGANQGFRTRRYGLKDVSISISRFDDLTHAFFDIINNRTSVVIEIQPGGQNVYTRGWFVLESIAPGGDVASLESEELTFQLDGNADSNFSVDVGLAWLFLDENCTVITDWTDGDVDISIGTGISSIQTSYDGEAVFKFTGSDTPDAGIFARRYIDLGSEVLFGTETTIEIELYHAKLGTLTDVDYFKLNVSVDGALSLNIAFASDGLYVHDGSSYVEAGSPSENAVLVGQWQKWRFVLSHTSDPVATVSIQVDNGNGWVTVATGVDASDTSAVVDGRVDMIQYCENTADLITYVNYINIG